MVDGKETKKVGGWGRLNKYAMREIRALHTELASQVLLLPLPLPGKLDHDTGKETQQTEHDIYYFTEAAIIKIVYDDRHILSSPLNMLRLWAHQL